MHTGKPRSTGVWLW